MFLRFLIGGGLTVLCVTVSGLGLWLADTTCTQQCGWLGSPPRRRRLLAVVVGASLLALVAILAGRWVWTAAFLVLGVFASIEEALCFPLVAYTTLGFGDVPPADEWRILATVAAANGLINIGLLTTLLIEGLSHVRTGYRRTVLGEDAKD